MRQKYCKCCDRHISNPQFTNHRESKVCIKNHDKNCKGNFHREDLDKPKLPIGWFWQKRHSDIKGWIIEIVCPHGIGHDNDVHGCDGCCANMFK